MPLSVDVPPTVKLTPSPVHHLSIQSLDLTGRIGYTFHPYLAHVEIGPSRSRQTSRVWVRQNKQAHRFTYRGKGPPPVGRMFSIAGQYLGTLLLVMLGVSVYSCSDSASVNPVVELASLTVTPGTLQPSFSGATTQYTVDLANTVTSVTVTAQPAVAGDSVTINGQATTSRPVQLGEAGTTTPVNIVVSESGTNSRTYTVLLRKASLTGNNSLRSLSISPGSLEPEFNGNTLSYEVSVTGNADSMRVTPTLDDPAATMTVNGQTAASGQAQTVPLRDPGQTTILTIIITAQNGSQKSYFITVERAALSSDNNLEALTITPGSLEPSFASGTLAYRVEVATRVTSVDVSATKSDPNAVISGSLPNQGRATIPLDGPGTSTVVSIIVTAPNGSAKTYGITVHRLAPSTDSNLSSLTVSAGSLNPGFAAGMLNYTVDVASTIDSLTASATKSDPDAVMSASGAVIAPPGDPTGSVTVPLGLGTSTSIAITVTAEDRVSTKIYRITVNRPAR